MSRQPHTPATLPITIGIAKLTPIAVFPRKPKDNSPYYSLAIVGRTDGRPEDTAHRVENFSTNLAFSIPADYYVEITASEHLQVQGYFLAQGTITLGPGDTEELIIPLYKYAETQDLELPSEILQFVVKKQTPAYCSLLKGIPAPSAREAPGFSTNNTFYQPPAQPASSQQGRGASRSASFMPEFAEASSPSPVQSSSRSASMKGGKYLF